MTELTRKNTGATHHLIFRLEDGRLKSEHATFRLEDGTLKPKDITFAIHEVFVHKTDDPDIAKIFEVLQGEAKLGVTTATWHWERPCEHEMTYACSNDVSFVYECNKIGCSHTEEVVLKVPETLEQAKSLAEYQKLGMVTLKHVYPVGAGDCEADHYTFLTTLTGKQLEDMSDEQIAERFEIDYDEDDSIEYTYYPHPPIK